MEQFWADLLAGCIVAVLAWLIPRIYQGIRNAWQNDKSIMATVVCAICGQAAPWLGSRELDRWYTISGVGLVCPRHYAT